MKPDTFYKLVTIAVISAILAACQSMNSTVGGYLNLDTDLQIDFKVDADINPDETGKPSPLFIRLYELKAVKMINKAGFLDLYERDKEMLGADMVAVYKLKRFKPGESRTEHFVLDSQTRYVALFAEFLKYRESKHKLIIPVTANNVFANSVVVRVSGDELVFDQKANSESTEHE